MNQLVIDQPNKERFKYRAFVDVPGQTLHVEGPSERLVSKDRKWLILHHDTWEWVKGLPENAAMLRYTLAYPDGKVRTFQIESVEALKAVRTLTKDGLVVGFPSSVVREVLPDKETGRANRAAPVFLANPKGWPDETCEQARNDLAKELCHSEGLDVVTVRTGKDDWTARFGRVKKPGKQTWDKFIEETVGAKAPSLDLPYRLFVIPLDDVDDLEDPRVGNAVAQIILGARRAGKTVLAWNRGGIVGWGAFACVTGVEAVLNVPKNESFTRGHRLILEAKKPTGGS
jgi:hypothetical protein